MNTNSSLFAKEEVKGEEISEQTDKPRQPSSISYAPMQQALLGSTPPDETKEEPKEETETPKAKEAVQTVEVKTTIYLDANKNEKKDKEEKGVSDIEVRLYKMQEGTAEKEASYQAITNIKGEVCLKDVETGSYRIEYESMDSEKDLKDYTIIQEKKDITKATDKEKELNKKTDIKKTEKENKTILYQEEVEIQEGKELEAALYKEEKEPEETKNGSKTEASKETKVETENKETSKQEVVKKQTETAKEEATKQEETSKSIPQLHKLAATQVGAAYGADSDLIKALNEVLDVEDWTFHAYYVGQSDSYQIEKKNDFNLKYQMEFHNNRDLAANDVEIRIPAALLIDRDGKKIMPNSIAIPEGSKENPVASRITPFNYYLDENTNELVFFNYKDIVAGSNVAFQVLYKNIEIMQIEDGTSWSLTPRITVKMGEGSEVKETTPLKGTIDTQINLTNVKKSTYTTGKSYYPGIYTKKQLQKTVAQVDQKYLDNFDDYYFVAWKINIDMSATQPWNLYLKEIPGTDGELVGYDSDYQLSSSSKYKGYHEIYKGRRAKSSSTSIIAVTAYPKDGAEPSGEFVNNVDVIAEPADLKDSVQTKQSTANWKYVDYEWKYPNDAVGVNKTGGNTYRGWVEVFKANRKNGQDMENIPFHVNSLTRGYKMTHHVTNEENKLGERIEGAAYKMTTVDDFIYVYPNTGTSTSHKILDSKDYYYNQVTIQQKDTGYDPWEDETAAPEESGSMIVYAMYETPSEHADEKGWEKVEEVAWKDSGSMSYTFSKEQLARRPWRVKVEHESVNYHSTCTIDVKVTIRHDSPIFNALIKEEEEGQNLTLENIAGVMTEKLQDGETEYVVTDTTSGTTNYAEPGLKELTEALYDGNLLIRDNAYAQLYSADKHARSYKYGTNWNDPVNGRVNLKYNIMAYDGYEVYGREVVEKLKEGKAQQPGRKEVVFYDLLPYGVKYDPSVDIKAGRVKSTDQGAVRQEKTWDSGQVRVTLDSKEDIITNYKNSGRTMLRFHVHYEGEDPTVLTSYGSDQLWMEGWGISFGAYYDWKDIDICNAATNISAFMPAQKDDTALLGQDNEVMKDNGQAYPSGMKEEYQIFGSDIDNDGNTEEKTVLYASTSIYDDMAIASSSEIVKDVRADDDRFGIYTKSAIVEPKEGYTYEITVKNAKGTLKNIVVYDLLEDAPNHLSSKEHKEDFEENWWYGSFDGVITTALEKAGAKPVIYYNEKRDARITKEAEDPSSVLTEENGWIEASSWKKELKEVKAVAVDLRKEGFAIKEMGAISFQIHMVSPEEDESREDAEHSNTAKGDRPASYAYNNTGFYSETEETKIKQTVIGNSVQVTQHDPETVEIVKEYKGKVPESRKGEEFRFIASYNGSSYATQEYQLFKKIDGTWERQGTNRVYATEADGSFYLHAEEKAVFQVKDKNQLTVEEEENPFWKVETEIKEQDEIQIRTYKNTYRPVLYVQKKLEGYAKDVDVSKDTFTFKASAEGKALANAEYWLVDSVRLDGGVPKKLGTGTTNENGEFNIHKNDIIALFPGTEGTSYEIEETQTGDDWFSDDTTVNGIMVIKGNIASITNYYKWKDVYLTKELKHQEADKCEQAFTFQVESNGEPFVDAEWVILNEDGTESETKGRTDGEGRFSAVIAGKTVKIKGFEAGTKFKIIEIDEDESDDYEPITGTAEGTIPLYALKSDAVIVNDYLLRPLSVSKIVTYNSTGMSADKITEINEAEFTMQIKVNGELYKDQDYTLMQNGNILEISKTDEEGKFTIRNNQTAVFEGIGRAGTKYTVQELQEEGTQYPQIYPTEGKAAEGIIEKEGSKVTIINGTDNTLIIGKEYVAGEEDNGAGAAYVEELKTNATARANEKVTLKLERINASGKWETFPSSSSTFKVINTLTGKIESKYWYGLDTIQLESWQQVIVDTLDKDVRYRLSKDKKDQHKLYKKGSDFIEISQQDPKNDEAISGTVGDRPLAIIKNEIVGRNQESSIQKKMHLGSNEVATGARLVYQVERYDGKVWNPAEQVRYIVGDDSGWIDKQSQVTEKDGKIVVEKTEQGYPIVYFTDEDVKINPSKVEEGAYRIRELIEESDKEWGMLSGYIGLAESYNGSLDIKDANTFVNSNRTTTIEIAKELDVESNQDFTFTLKQVMQSKTETIESIDEILETRIGTNIDYGIYDSKSNEEIGKGNTGITGEIKLKGNQYARLEIADGTIWLVNEKQDTPYVLTGISGNNENTKKLSDNAMIIQGRAPIILSDLSINTNKKYFMQGSEIDKDDFEVTAIYSDEMTKQLSNDEYEIDQTIIPNSGTVFNLKFTYTDKKTGEVIEKNKALNIAGTIELTSSMVDNGVVDAITGKPIVLNKGNVEIPEIIIKNNYPYFITKIGFAAYQYNTDITSVKIPNTITSIGSQAFSNCTGLSGELVIPDSVIILGGSAFRECSNLTGALVIPNSVTYIGEYAFQGCSSFSGDLIVPDSVKSVGTHAFSKCKGFDGTLSISSNINSLGPNAFSDCVNITGEVTIPNSLDVILMGTFSNCSSITKVNIPETITSIKGPMNTVGTYYKDGAFYNCISLKEIQLPSKLNEIGNCSFYNCSGLVNNLAIPSTVTSIGDEAFYQCEGLSGNLNIPNSVTSIGRYTFYGCKGLTGDLIISDSVTSIGNYAFKKCSGLKKVEISQSVKVINYGTFSGCTSLESLRLSDELTKIEGYYNTNKDNADEGAFYNCTSLATVNIPNTVEEIGNFAFYGCSKLKGKLIIPNTVTYIGVYAFYNCMGFDETLTIGNNVKNIGNSAFYNCKGFKGDLSIPDSVTSIGNFAFYNCKGFTGSLIIPDSVTNIGDSAFSDCSGFTGSLTIGNSVTSIGESAFKRCNGFTGSLVIPNSVTSIGGEAFSYCEGFTGSLVIPNSVTSIGDDAFSYCKGFTGSLTIPDSVTSIGSSAFLYCEGFTGSLIIPNSVTSIGSSAFRYCEGFTGALTIPNSVISIGASAFKGCKGLINVSISDEVKTIESGTFSNCTSLEFVKLPNKLISIKCDYSPMYYASEGAFYNCTSLTTIDIPETVNEIGNSTFYECQGLTGDLVIPNSVTRIGESAFYDCSGFTGSLTIGNSVTSIGNKAFYDCSGFTDDLIIPNTVTSIGDSAFSWCSGFTGDLIIPDSVTSIGNYAFLRCDNLEKIIIQGKSEGEILGSPWGAPDTVTIEWQPSQEGA